MDLDNGSVINANEKKKKTQNIRPSKTIDVMTNIKSPKVSLKKAKETIKKKNVKHAAPKRKTNKFKITFEEMSESTPKDMEDTFKRNCEKCTSKIKKAKTVNFILTPDIVSLKLGLNDLTLTKKTTVNKTKQKLSKTPKRLHKDLLKSNELKDKLNYNLKRSSRLMNKYLKELNKSSEPKLSTTVQEITPLKMSLSQIDSKLAKEGLSRLNILSTTRRPLVDYRKSELKTNTKTQSIKHKESNILCKVSNFCRKEIPKLNPHLFNRPKEIEFIEKSKPTGFRRSRSLDSLNTSPKPKDEDVTTKELIEKKLKSDLRYKLIQRMKSRRLKDKELYEYWNKVVRDELLRLKPKIPYSNLLEYMKGYIKKN